MKINNYKIFSIFLVLSFLLSCEDIFTRFKYETYECGKNPVKLKKIFIKNYEIGELVDVEFKNDAFKMEIIENSDQVMILKRKGKIKDTGNILPGHGGVLDRLDGIFFGIPIGFIFMVLIY